MHRVVSLFDDGKIAEDIRQLGVPVDVLRIGPFLERRRLLAVLSLLTRYMRQHRPDIVEAHLTYSRILGLLAAWRAGVQVRIAFEPGDIYLKSWKFRLVNFLGQFWADRIVVCSHALADWNHQTHRIRRAKMEVFHNCVDIERFKPLDPADFVPPFERPLCETLFCTVGSLGTGVNKRVDVSIRAIAAARAKGANVGLVIAGDGSQREALEDLAHELGIAPHVLFLGIRHDIPAIMQACDAFCHAAPFEPFGIVCIEAMAMNLPVIVPDKGGIHEAVDEGMTGYIYPTLDHQSLAARMVHLHQNAKIRQRMGSNGRAVVKQRFTVGVYMERLHALYQSIEGRKRK